MNDFSEGFLDQDVSVRVDCTPDSIVVFIEVERWVDNGSHGMGALGHFLIVTLEYQIRDDIMMLIARHRWMTFLF